MKTLADFQDYLFSQHHASQSTVKNYASDIRRFIRWYENRFHEAFSPVNITSFMLKEFKTDQTTSGFGDNHSTATPAAARSVDRYLSSLRKFFTYLEDEAVISTNPFTLLDTEGAVVKSTDYWRLQGFKDFLYREKASDLTIKNYIIDIQQFTQWLTEVMRENSHFEVSKLDLFSRIDPVLLEEYKQRLLHEAKAAPATVNRKLSALRKYLVWAQSEGLMKSLDSSLLPTNTDGNHSTVTKPIENAHATEVVDHAKILASLPEGISETTIPEEIPHTPFEYSSFPPLRLLQRIVRSGLYLFDIVMVLPFLAITDKIAYGMWLTQGSPVFFTPAKPLSKRINEMLIKHNLYRFKPQKPKIIRSIPKSFYAPLAISLENAPLHKKMLFHLKHTRPQWYKTYHSYAFVHYVHAALLILCMSAAGFGVVRAFAGSTEKSVAFASLPDGPPRLLSFSGRLTGSDAAPITANTNLRFSIYNDATATGSAQLWEEVQNVDPDENGSFNLMLGSLKSIPQRLFKDNARLYIGMTVEKASELTPRKQIPTEVLAATADTLQGLRPISDPQAGEKNAILTLDSSGNMVIGGNANPSFVATGGKFTLAGKALLLTTTPGSNADIQLIPDGFGKIDIQKAIHNTSESISSSGITGAVAIDDTLAITASQSGQSALYINQNATGPLISASSSGIARFTLENTGAATFGDSIMLYGNSLNSTQTSFNLLTTNPINLAIGTSATSLSLGGTGGITTINNSQTILTGNVTINGTTGLTFGNAAAGITFSGQGAHVISATNGSLELGAVKLTGNLGVGQNINIVPSSIDGTNNLGSASNPFDTIYVNTIVSSNVQNGGYWQSQNGTMAPLNLNHSLLVGSTASESAVWQVFASGANSGTASTSGNLSFRGNTTSIDQLNGGSLQFRTSPGGDSALTSRLTITNNGNIGLGTTTPEYRLDIPNNADASGQGRANAWVTYSSKRFKENIVAIDKPLEKISQLTGVYYNWKASYGGSRDIGFIAEEVGLVLPELVEWEADGINAKSLKYDRITALTIEGIKAQQDEILRIDTLINSVVLTNDRSFHIIAANDSFKLGDNTGQEIKTRGGFAEAVIARLTAGLTTTQKLKSEYINARDIQVTGTLKGDKADILSLRTDDIRSRSANPAFALGLSETNLVFYGLHGDEKTQVASLNNQGTLALNGSVIARDGSFAELLTAKNATVNDTLTAQKLVADELDLSNEGIMKLAAKIAAHLPNHNDSEGIAMTQNIPTTPLPLTGTGDASPSATPVSSPITPGITTEYDDFASGSAEIALVDAGNIDSENIGAPMPSGAGYVVSDLSVADTLTVSGNFVLSENSIDVVGADLQIQPLRSGAISFMAGLVSISKTGDLVVGGNAVFAQDVTVQGKLQAGIISPIENQNLVLALGNDPAVDQSLIVSDATGAARLKIRESGDVESEGAGTFAGLLSQSLTIIRGSQVDASPVQTIASSSAGNAVILPGQTQRTIITPFVKATSLIYITPTSDTYGFVPYVSRQTPQGPNGAQGSFTIEIAEPVSKPIKLNWWIVN